MEKLYNNQIAEMSSAAVVIDYYRTVDDVKTATKIYKKINSDPSIIFYIFAGMFCVFSIPFFYSYYENLIVLHRTLFYSVPSLLYGILFLIVAVICVFLPFYIDNAAVRHYQKYPHKNSPYHFMADSDGIVIANKTYSARIDWKEITDVVEHQSGFYVGWNQSYVFLPAKYLTVEKVSALRNFFKYFCEKRIRSLGNIEIKNVVFPCDKFTMCPLIGEKKYSVSGEDTREKYERSVFIIWRYSLIKFVLLLLPIILISYSILIFACSKVFFAISIIIASVVVEEILFRYIVKIIARKEYLANSRYSESIVSVYENAVMFEANGLVRVIEYKNIANVRDCDGDILIISKYAEVIRIPESDDGEEIKNYIRIKAMTA